MGDVRQIWVKGTLSFRKSTSSLTGPQWFGVDLVTGEVLASSRWDIPAGARPLADLLKAEHESELRRDIRNAEISKKPADHVCYAYPTLSCRAPAVDKLGDGAFGLVLDSAAVTVLERIPPAEMAWITTPERRALFDAFARLSAEHLWFLVRKVVDSGVPMTVHAHGYRGWPTKFLGETQSDSEG